MTSVSGFPKAFVFACVAALVVVSGPANAQSIPQELSAACGKEIKTYCSKVTPGEGRIVACLYSYGDKLSDNCAYAIIDGSERFTRMVDALHSLARNTSCRSDIAQYCKGIPPGGGRVYGCLKKHFATLNDGCRKVVPNAEDMLKAAGIIQ